MVMFSKELWNKLIITEEEWRNIACNVCGTTLITDKTTDFGEFKVCPLCGEEQVLIRRIPSEWTEG